MKPSIKLLLVLFFFFSGLTIFAGAALQAQAADDKGEGASGGASTPAAGTTSGSGTSASADGKEAKKEKEEVVRTGIIANTGNFGFGPTNVDVDSGGSSPGEEASVVTASVSTGREKCIVTINNASKENAYSVRYKVTGINARGAKVLSKSFSDNLKPGASEKKEMTCSPDLNMTVELTSATQKK